MLFTCSYYLNASKRFLEDSVLKTEDEDVVVRSADFHAAPIGGNLHLTLLHHVESESTYKNKKESTTTVHKLVLMDGSLGVFKAQLNTSCNRNVLSWSIAKGSTITVKRWNWIWCDNQSLVDCKAITRGVLLIHDFTWIPAPTSKPCAMELAQAPVYIPPRNQYVTRMLTARKEREDARQEQEDTWKAASALDNSTEATAEEKEAAWKVAEAAFEKASASDKMAASSEDMVVEAGDNFLEPHLDDWSSARSNHVVVELDMSGEVAKMPVIASNAFVTQSFDWEVVDYTQEFSFVGWLTNDVHEDNKIAFMLLTDDEIRAGKFIKHVEAKKQYLASLTGEEEHHSRSDDSDNDVLGEATNGCNCKTRFGIGVCVCLQFPINTMHDDRQNIFEDASTRFDNDSRIADSFDDLPPSKKRWCMHWWYSINVFQVQGCCNKMQLPNCYVDMIRKQYPNNKEEFFTGYKRSEQKVESNARKRAKHLQDLTNDL